MNVKYIGRNNIYHTRWRIQVEISTRSKYMSCSGFMGNESCIQKLFVLLYRIAMVTKPKYYPFICWYKLWVILSHLQKNHNIYVFIDIFLHRISIGTTASYLKLFPLLLLINYCKKSNTMHNATLQPSLG